MEINPLPHNAQKAGNRKPFAARHNFVKMFIPYMGAKMSLRFIENEKN